MTTYGGSWRSRPSSSSSSSTSSSTFSPAPSPRPHVGGARTTRRRGGGGRRCLLPSLLLLACFAIASFASHVYLAHRAASRMTTSSFAHPERTTHLAPLVRKKHGGGRGVVVDGGDLGGEESDGARSRRSAGNDDDDDVMPIPSRIVVVGEMTMAGNDDRDFDDDVDVIAVTNVLRSAFSGTNSTSQYGIITTTTTIVRDGMTAWNDTLTSHELDDVVTNAHDSIWLLVVRSPCLWSDALIRRRGMECDIREGLRGPVEAGKNGNVDDQGESRDEWCMGRAFASEADYYRMPWYDDDDMSKGTVRRRYDDIFDMRRRRLLLLKQVMDAMPRRIKVLRLGEFDLNPDVLVKDLIKEYGLVAIDKYAPASPRIDPILGRRSGRIDDDDDAHTCMEYPKWKEAMQRIDWNLEGYFGHNRLDSCRLCRDSDGYPLSSSNENDMPHIEERSPPTSIYILGERNSGTTFVSNTLAMAFDPPNVMGSNLEKFSTDVPVLLHKHMFRHDLLDDGDLREIRSRKDVLWIMVVRSPCDWAEAMFRKPYHFCPPKKPEMCGPGSDPNKKLWLNQNFVAGMSLLDFFDVEWGDWAESVPFLRDKGREAAGVHSSGEEVSISKVSANYTYPNVFRLRRHKFEIMRQIFEAVPRNVKFVQLKELERSPEMFIQSLVREFNLTVKDGYEPQSPSKVVHTTVCLTPTEWDSAQNKIDWKIEAQFGFSPFECRMCHGYVKSKNLYNRVMEGKKVKELVNVKQRVVRRKRRND